MAIRKRYTPEQEMALKVRIDTLYNTAFGYMTQKQFGNAAVSWKYYHGNLPALQIEGGDDYVERIVEECVNTVLQDMLTVFTSQDDAVVIEPTYDLPTEVAKALTDMVNKILIQDNNGYNALHDAWKEMLVARNGFIKHWWDEQTIYKTDSIEGADINAVGPYLQTFQSNPNIDLKDEDIEIIEYEDGTADVSIKYSAKIGKIKVMYVPINEILVDEGARTIDQATYFCHRTRMTKAALLDMGFDPEKVEKLTYRNDEDFNLVSWERTAGAYDPYDDNGEADDDFAGYVWLNETYVRTSVLEKDKKVKLYQVFECQGEILGEIEEVDKIPFTTFTALPIPGTIFGESITDLSSDLQDLASRMMRASIDNAQNIAYGRYKAVLDAIDKRSLLDNRPGSVVEITDKQVGLNAIGLFEEQPLPPSVGIVLQGLEAAKEARTGVSKVSQGISKDMMKSDKGFDSIQFLVSRSQGRSRMMARNVARSFSDLIRAIVDLYREKGTIPLSVHTPQGIVPVMPNQIPVDISLKIKPALSESDKQEEAQRFLATVQGLNMIQAQQAMFAGPLQKYSQSVRFLDIMGHKDPATWMMNITEWQPPQPNPQDVADYQKTLAETSKISNEAQAILHKAGLDTQDFETRAQVLADEQNRKDMESAYQQQHAADDHSLKEKIALAQVALDSRKLDRSDREQTVHEFKAHTEALEKQGKLELHRQELDLKASGVLPQDFSF